MTAVTEVWSDKKGDFITFDEEVSVAPFPEHAIDGALGMVVNSEWVQAECENANYHSALEFLAELIPYAQKEMEMKKVGWPNG